MLQWNDTQAIRARNRQQDLPPNLIVDPNNHAEMAVLAAACVLAKFLAYADGEAFCGGWAVQTTPAIVWTSYTAAEKEAWIVRAMTVLKALHGYGLVQPAKVLDFESRGVDGDTHRRAADVGDSVDSNGKWVPRLQGQLHAADAASDAGAQALTDERHAGSTPADSHHTCIYCGRSSESDFCSLICEIDAQNEGAD